MDVNNFIINLIFTYKNKNQLKIHSKYVFEFMLDIFSKSLTEIIINWNGGQKSPLSIFMNDCTLSESPTRNLKWHFGLENSIENDYKNNKFEILVS